MLIFDLSFNLRADLLGRPPLPMEVDVMLQYEVQCGHDVRFFYGSLDGLVSYLGDCGVRSDDVDEVVYLSDDLEADDSKWFPWCGVTVICREMPPIGGQGPR